MGAGARAAETAILTTSMDDRASVTAPGWIQGRRRHTFAVDEGDGSMTDSRDKLDVAIILANEGYASTAVGPIEVFASAGAMYDEMRGADPAPRFRVTMASIDGEAIESAYGLRIVPDVSIDDLGAADLVFVSASGPWPSEWMARHAALPPWLADRYRRGAMLAGVCSGVAFLAEAGLLDGRRATTTGAWRTNSRDAIRTSTGAPTC